MRPLISLVIPVYNVEKYLPACIDGVLSQTYENFEAILVDDGSTDNSGRMCDAYCSRDKRMLALHKQNGGLSDARNFGVKHARGEYVSFVDSDDVITPDYLDHLYTLIEENQADISCGQIEKRNTTAKRETAMSDSVQLLTPEDALIEMCYDRDVSVSACAKLYKKELLNKYPYPVGMLYEDLATTHKLIGDVTRIAVSKRVIYYYYIHDGSIMHDNMTEKQFMILNAADEQLGYIKAHYPQAEQSARVRCASAAIGLLSHKDFFSNGNRRAYFSRVQKYIRPHLRMVLRDRIKPLSFKIGCIAVAMGYYPAKVLWRIKRILNV